MKTNHFIQLIQNGKLQEIKQKRLELAQHLLQTSLDAKDISLQISAFNEQVIEAICKYFSQEYPWFTNCTFLEFGSGARGEQVLNSDQDNGLILPSDFHVDRHELEELCQKVVMTIDGTGIVLCPGKIMISEENWRATPKEWQKKIIFWLENPQERGSWQSGLILDFKPLFGQHQNAFELRSEVVQTVSKHPIILKILVSEILNYKVPLSFWGNFILEKKDGFSGLNLKNSILAHIINGARLLALKYKFMQTNTISRLNWLKQAKHIDPSMANDLIELWNWGQRKRLENSLCPDHPSHLANYLNPHLLPKEEKKLLKKRLHSLQKFLDIVNLAASYGL
ncbi:MAG: DUF294 nucleotidyltransferase-like domain-containing protein [Desulfonauticus sp.]|nr:DUF294 nucleotidyltransferase-like domain-containing protein [Desulfonauticus sp.]